MAGHSHSIRIHLSEPAWRVLSLEIERLIGLLKTLST
jgi:hypothetical protein